MKTNIQISNWLKRNRKRQPQKHRRITRVGRLRTHCFCNWLKRAQSWWVGSSKSSSRLCLTKSKSQINGITSRLVRALQSRNMSVLRTLVASATWTQWCSSSSWLQLSDTTSSAWMMAFRKITKNTKGKFSTITCFTNCSVWSLISSYPSARTTIQKASAFHSRNSMDSLQTHPSKKMLRNFWMCCSIDLTTHWNQQHASICFRVFLAVNSAVKWSVPNVAK